MIPGPALLLALLISASAAPAPPDHRDLAPPPLMLKTRERIESAIADIRPMLAELDSLSRLYGSPSSFRRAAMRRRVLRMRLRQSLNELEALGNDYRSQKGVVETQLGLMAFVSLGHGGRIKDHLGKIMLARRMNEILDAERNFEKEIKEALDEDEAAYESGRGRYMLHSAFLYGGGAAVLFAVAGLIVAFRRRSAPAVASNASAASAPVPQGLSASTGRIIGGNYRLVRELGRGGMGVVYEAFDGSLDRRVAIKQMHEELSRNARELEMFLSEARLVASLKHPNIVEIHHILHEGGQTYLVFEYVEGRTLDAYLNEGGRLSLRSAKSIVRQVASALDYAHSARVIHRDLKPANIMITPQGVAKVMDFGIAHRAKATVARLTRVDAWGTPGYMAPEQELGNVSRESDLYSLAVCLYEMLTGSPPFEGPNYLAQKTSMRYLPPSERSPDLPKEIDLIVARGLRAEPKERFRSATELSSALEVLQSVGA